MGNSVNFPTASSMVSKQRPPLQRSVFATASSTASSTFLPIPKALMATSRTPVVPPTSAKKTKTAQRAELPPTPQRLTSPSNSRTHPARLAFNTSSKSIPSPLVLVPTPCLRALLMPVVLLSLSPRSTTTTTLVTSPSFPVAPTVVLTTVTANVNASMASVASLAKNRKPSSKRLPLLPSFPLLPFSFVPSYFVLFRNKHAHAQ